MDDNFYTLVPRRKTVAWRLNRIQGRELVFRHGHIAITNYTLGDNPSFEKSLSVWDEMAWKYRRTAGYYVKELKEFRVPRCYDIGSLAYFFRGCPVRFDNDAYPADAPDYDLLVPPRDDAQRVALAFLCSQGDFTQNKDYTTLMVDLPTGDGKTYCCTAAAAFMHARVCVFAPTRKVIDQWKESFLSFTSLKKDEVLIVRGSDKCKKILDGEYDNVKVFIFSTDTVTSFAKTYGDMEAMEMLMATKAYLKIIDEVHMDLKANNHIEALSNQRMTIYASATPGRTDPYENRIFNTLYRNIPRFGSKFRTKDELFLDIMAVYFRFVPTAQQIKNMVNPRTKWLNNKTYEKTLLFCDNGQNADFYNKFVAMLKWSKRLLKEGNKILILCATRDGTMRLEQVAEEIFPGQCSHYYETGMSKTEKALALEKTVICATSQSLGTGADIKGIQHVHNVSTYANWIGANQISGRARKLPDGTQVVYIEYVNAGYIKTLRQYEKRKPELLKKARTGKIMTVQ